MRLFREHIRRTWKMACVGCLGLFAFHMLVVRVFIGFSASDEKMFGGFLPKGIQAFLGLDKLPINTLTGFLSVAYQHPFVVAAMLAVPVAAASALLAGEIERKTVAVLLSRPVSRSGIVFSCAATVALWCVVMVCAAVAGNLAGIRMFHPAGADQMGVLYQVALNLLMLSLAAGGIAVMFSALTSERGDAAGWTLTVLLLMYGWNFLAQFWPLAKDSAAFTLFHYYSPARVFLSGAVSMADCGVLGAVAIGGVLIGLIAFARRDLSV